MHCPAHAYTVSALPMHPVWPSSSPPLHVQWLGFLRLSFHLPLRLSISSLLVCPYPFHSYLVSTSYISTCLSPLFLLILTACQAIFICLCLSIHQCFRLSCSAVCVFSTSRTEQRLLGLVLSTYLSLHVSYSTTFLPSAIEHMSNLTSPNRIQPHLTPLQSSQPFSVCICLSKHMYITFSTHTVHRKQEQHPSNLTRP